MTKTATMKLPKDTKRKLPDGWRWVRLEKVCKLRTGGTPSKADPTNFGGNIRWLVSGDIHQGEIADCVGRITAQGMTNSNAGLLPPDCVMIALNGQGKTRGTVALLCIEATCNQSLAAMITRDRNVLLPRFLLHQLQMRYQELRDLTGDNHRSGLSMGILDRLEVILAPIEVQRRIAGVMREQMAAVEQARAAARARLDAALALPVSFVRESVVSGKTRRHSLGDCLIEVRNGVGHDWAKYPVLGATRDGVAPAKEGVGKTPERYKFVDPVTVFYNPMRILLGSIAMVDEGDAPGITSPDYVVVKGRPGVLDTRWFYYWFRSTSGAHLIDSLSRGAVRERILFNRLAAGEIELPAYEIQLHASERMKQVRPIVESITNELETINALPAALLRRAFAGKV